MSERLGIYSELELQAARRLVREILRSVRGYRLYEGGDHPTFEGMLRELRKKWDDATAGGPLSLRLTEKTVLLADGVVHRAESRAEILPALLYDNGVVGLVLRRGIGARELRRFVSVLAHDPEELVDCASLLWEADLQHVQVLLDIDDLDEDLDDAKTPEDFVRQVQELGDEDDPPVLSEFEREREELTQQVARQLDEADEESPSLRGLTHLERAQIARLRADDDFVGAARHAMRVVHDMAREPVTADEAATLEKAVDSLVGAMAGSADLEGVREMLLRARGMSASENPVEMRTGELTLAVFQEPEILTRFLHSLDRLEELEATQLAECLALLQPASAGTVAAWLADTAHPEPAALAMRVFGEAAVHALVPVYRNGDEPIRARVAPALLEIGTPEAVEALASEFVKLPEKTRMELVKVAERSQDAGTRATILDALHDPAPKVRRAAVAALRRQDAPELARELPRLLEGVLALRADARERKSFFEAVARIGDGAVARVLAAQVPPKPRLALRRPKLTGMQRLCVKTLRRMRSPEARVVADELRASGPREAREILDDPLAGLD